VKLAKNLVLLKVYDNIHFDKIINKMIIKEINEGYDGNGKAYYVYGTNDVTRIFINKYQMPSIKSILLSTFLPAGYPNSVRPEYLSYQAWDSIQCISSSIRNVMTSKGLLQKAGVGSAEASALSAAIIFSCNDGIGMIGSLLFAYCYSNNFEVYVKEWRLFADVLNNVGLSLDLIIPLLPSSYYILFTSLSTLSKACCGLIAGATKARISSHFAYKGHLAEVTAKESTQETGVSFLGLLFGIILSSIMGGNDDKNIGIFVFIGLLLLHQIANYMLMKTLVFDVLNPQRLYLIVEYFFNHDNNFNNNDNEMIENIKPKTIAIYETLYRPYYLGNYGPILGYSLIPIIECIDIVNNKYRENYSLDMLYSICADEKYIIGINKNRRIVVCLGVGCNENDLIKSYIASTYLFHYFRKNKVTNIYIALKLIIIDNALKNAINKAQRCFQLIINSNSWDINDNKTRLGEGTYRYSCN
jgi:hypothetical protein